jgi:TRAP-type C4-dicarboxylate transport system permease small subunit
MKYFVSHQLSINTQLPLWIAYFFVPVAALMLGLRYIVELRFLLKDKGTEWIKNRLKEIETGGHGHS